MLTLTLNPTTINQIAQIVKTHTPVLLHGAPGIGKTAHIAQKVAEHLHATLRPFIASHHDPVAIHGLPAPDFEAGTTKSLINDFFMEVIEAATDPQNPKPQLIFFDELTNSPPAHYGALMDAIQERKIAGRRLPDNVYLLAAGNRLDDGSIVQPMPSPARNRFFHIEVEPDLTQYTSYLLQHSDLSPQVTTPIASFLQANPDCLTPKKSHLQDRTRMAFPSPRSWHTAAKAASALISATGQNKTPKPALTPDIAQMAASGAVGEDIAAEFAAHVELDSGLPSMCAVAAGKNPAFEPSSPAAHYALAMRLSSLLLDIAAPLTSGRQRRLGCECYKNPQDETLAHTEQMLRNVVDYAEAHLAKDMVYLTIRTALQADEGMKRVGPVREWYVANVDLFV